MIPNASLKDESESRSRQWIVWAMAALVAVGFAAGGLWWHWRGLPVTTRSNQGDDADDDEPALVNPGYVGPRACAPCHEKRVTEFLTTRHSRACRAPESDDMPPGFAP
jgi:hypothetical protein